MPKIEQYDWSKLTPPNRITSTANFHKPKQRNVKIKKKSKAKDKSIYKYNDKALISFLKNL